ncbi:GNAT family N-acetyltransferase [Phenylobacterium sp.]|uniref:GNAT family N-acetyltransferase n=1 Tax=Phenylobacterium sp. TaxID=1871053 RepID=UPI002F427D34
MIETERLILRTWSDADREPYAALNADPRVGDWLGGVRTKAQTDAAIDRFNAGIARSGYGFFAAERKADGRLVGMIGVDRFAPGEMPFGEAVEMAWRLSPDSWGAGLASEGAAAVLAWSWARVDDPEIVAITAQANLRSQAVMRRIGMTPDPTRAFDHPKLAADHPLRRHVLFSARRPA